MYDKFAAMSSAAFAPKYSLSHLTLLDCSLPELIYIASRAGYDAVSPRLIHQGIAGECPFPPLGADVVRAAANALQTTGLKVHDIELIAITEDFSAEKYLPALEVGGALGAEKLVASAWTRRGDDRDFLVDAYARICDLARPYGLSVGLEFPSFSRLRNLAAAADIVRAAGRPNGGILIDTLYLHMSRVGAAELESLPAHWLQFIQISDVLPGVPDTRAGMIQIARGARLYPGEGCIDFADIIERLPPVNYSIELPNRSRVAELGYEEHARRCLQTAKRALAPAVSKRPVGAGAGASQGASG
jgi:sugar phosphate isomerase/epimerase